MLKAYLEECIFVASLFTVCFSFFQTVSGRHRQGMSALHHLIGVAVASADQRRGLRMFMQNVEKEMMLFGVLCSKLGVVRTSIAVFL